MATEPVKAFVEVPKGSRNKYEYNEASGELEFDRRLFAAVSFPTDYGFISETRTGSGDPLDALICIDEPTFPGCVIPVRIIALFKMRDENGADHKALCVPLSDPAWSGLDEVDDLPGNLQEEISHFFDIYTQLEGQEVSVEGWGTRQEAIQVLEESRDRYRGTSG
jgi:inorganic pyrophosphatase